MGISPNTPGEASVQRLSRCCSWLSAAKAWVASSSLRQRGHQLAQNLTSVGLSLVSNMTGAPARDCKGGRARACTVEKLSITQLANRANKRINPRMMYSVKGAGYCSCLPCTRRAYAAAGIRTGWLTAGTTVNRAQWPAPHLGRRQCIGSPIPFWRHGAAFRGPATPECGSRMRQSGGPERWHHH